jgi:hypothetical protein
MDPDASKEYKEYMKHRIPRPQNRDECLEDPSIKEFQKAAAEALIDGDHRFFRRMEKAVKMQADGGIQNKLWGITDNDPIYVCYDLLIEFVEAKHKLPTVSELQELAGLSGSPDAWRRVNTALNLKGKLPRSGSD